MDVCDEKVLTRMVSLSSSMMIQGREHPHEETYFDQTRGQRACGSAFHPDTDAPLHDECVAAVPEERICTSFSCVTSLTECVLLEAAC